MDRTSSGGNRVEGKGQRTVEGNRTRRTGNNEKGMGVQRIRSETR